MICPECSTLILLSAKEWVLYSSFYFGTYPNMNAQIVYQLPMGACYGCVSILIMRSAIFAIAVLDARCLASVASPFLEELMISLLEVGSCIITFKKESIAIINDWLTTYKSSLEGNYT